MLEPTPTAASDLREAAGRVLRVLSYPVSSEIKPWAWDVRTDKDSVTYAVELLIAALAASPASEPISELKEAAFRLSPDDQYRLATILAGNLGYDLTPEPPHPDQPTGRISNYTIASKPDEAPDVEVRVVNPITGDTSVLSKRTGQMLRTERKDEALDVVAWLITGEDGYWTVGKDEEACRSHAIRDEEPVKTFTALVPLAALQSERRKREEAEADLAWMVKNRNEWQTATIIDRRTIASQAATIAELRAAVERAADRLDGIAWDVNQQAPSDVVTDLRTASDRTRARAETEAR